MSEKDQSKKGKNKITNNHSEFKHMHNLLSLKDVRKNAFSMKKGKYG